MNVVQLHPPTPEQQAAWDVYQAALAEYRSEQAEKRLKAMGVLA